MPAPINSARNHGARPAARRLARHRKHRRAARRKPPRQRMRVRKPPSRARRRRKRLPKSRLPNNWRSRVLNTTFLSIAPQFLRMILSENRKPLFGIMRAAQDYYFEKAR